MVVGESFSLSKNIPKITTKVSPPILIAGHTTDTGPRESALKDTRENMEMSPPPISAYGIELVSPEVFLCVRNKIIATVKAPV